ncbi:DNA polymerase III subunit delta [Camelimonas sp. ID_303_24]
MVAVKPADINAVLSRTPDAAAVLVYGPDAGLVAERVSRLVALVINNDDDPFRLVRLDGETVAADAMRLADEANTISLFGGKRAIVVRAGSKNMVPSLKPVLDAPPSDALIIVQAGDLARTSPLRTLCERSRAALAIPCYPDGPRELAALVDEIMAGHGLRMQSEARAHLLSLLGADRQTTRNEVEKLALYARGGGSVSIEDVDAICGDAASLAVDSLIDATFLGDIQRLDADSARLFADGSDPGVLVGFLLRHGLMLLSARTQLENGAPASQTLDRMRLHFKRKDAVERQLRTWPARDLLQITGDLGQAVAKCRQNAQMRHEIARVSMWAVAMRAARHRSRN